VIAPLQLDELLRRNLGELPGFYPKA